MQRVTYVSSSRTVGMRWCPSLVDKSRHTRCHEKESVARAGRRASPLDSPAPVSAAALARSGHPDCQADEQEAAAHQRCRLLVAAWPQACLSHCKAECNRAALSCITPTSSLQFGADCGSRPVDDQTFKSSGSGLLVGVSASVPLQRERA
ncbi:hypothetical protein PC114_g3374 [Phytophthora cactorum]|nr:hypothetical protein PC114_g3374 [Phytophthora cactorum]